jgi:RNA polymerase sigma factor (sigma-70 family)
MLQEDGELKLRTVSGVPPGASPSQGGFDAIYRHHAPILRAIATRRFRVPSADAEALVHDVFMSYLANPGIVRGALRPYFAGAIWNACGSYWRKRSVEEPLDTAVDPSTEPEEEITLRLSRTLALRATLSRLDPRCCGALRRMYFEGESVAAIAESLGLSQEYVKLLLHRCRLRARKIFDALTRIGS